MNESTGSDLGEVWARALERFDDASVPSRHRVWLGLTYPVGLVGDTALLAAPNELMKDYIETRLRSAIVEAISTELGREVRVAVTVMAPDELPNSVIDAETDDFAPTTALRLVTDDESLERDQPEDDTPPAATDGDWESESTLDLVRSRLLRPGPLQESASYHPDPGQIKAAHLNPNYEFRTFVIGAGNRLSHAAAVAVAEAPAKAYNPMFIYGNSGLGKTHLLHAIGHYTQELFPAMSVRYVSSEEFTNDFINSLRDDKMQAFQARYRRVDLLLIDDIQFLERAERTQEEFFHTFNTLHNASKQIVISSDRPPRQLRTLEDRLRTRFEWGLITDVQAPDLETRIAILRKKSARDQHTVPDAVMEYIASRIQSNIRELEGALIRITAFAGLNRQEIDLNLAELVLRDLVSESDSPEITAPIIMAVICEYFSVTMEDLTSTSRSRNLVGPRQIAMYLCRELTEMSLPKIGETFGGRDHTTVMHADKKVRAQMADKMSVYKQITELTSRIRERARAR